jgi:uncharacterized protein (TIGR03000 family)
MRKTLVTIALAAASLLMVGSEVRAQFGLGLGGYRGGLFLGVGRGYYGYPYSYGGFGGYPYYRGGWGYPYSYGSSYPYYGGVGYYGSSYYMPYTSSVPGYYSTPSYMSSTPYYYTTPYYYSYPSSYYSSYPSYYYSSPSVAMQSTGYRDSSYYDPNVVHMTVYVPNPDAQVWFDDVPTMQRGTERFFHTPPLQQGGTYTIKARWTEGNRTVDQQRRLQVQPGQSSTVDFRREDVPTPAVK